MRNIKLVIEYDGTLYCGWQKQDNALAVQQLIEEAIYSLTGENVILNGSGRTDAKVHALGQVANFMTNSTIPGDRFSHAINKYLPNDIVIRQSCEVDAKFHSRFSAKKKTYRYLIYNSYHRSAIFANYAEHCRGELDLELMMQAGKDLIGKHDFAAFMASGSIVKDTVREIFSVEIEKKDANIIQIEVCGNGFLYNMVRIIAGTLIEIGLKRLNVNCIKQALDDKQRSYLGYTAGASGLYLKSVEYLS